LRQIVLGREMPEIITSCDWASGCGTGFGGDP
jgi:hypothetical protein